MEIETWIRFDGQQPKQRIQLAKYYAKHIDGRGYTWQYCVSLILQQKGEFRLITQDGVSRLAGFKGIFYPTNLEKFIYPDKFKPKRSIFDLSF